MKYYSYIQNNSGGYFIGPIAVIIRAENSSQANQKANENGMYFDGNGDCPCCGRRWNAANESDADDEPHLYDCKIHLPNVNETFEDCLSKVNHDGDAYLFGYKGEKFLYIP